MSFFVEADMATILLLFSHKSFLLVFNFSSPGKENLNSLNLTDKIIQQSFYDNELNTIYKNAAVFVFPSEYEGFGIPALEAMACGCPVILSNTSSLPEIAEDAVLYFEPNNTAALSEAIIKILQDNNLKNSLITKGYWQVEKFSWDKMTNEYLETAKEILNSAI